MSAVTPWILPGLLFGFFLIGAAANAAILLLQPDEHGRKPSMVPLIPGIAGAIALAIAPLEVLHPWFWVPLVLDVGTGLYLLLIVVAMVGAALERPDPPAPPPKERAIVGCILGTAVGDAMGLACEGLSRQRQARMYPDLSGYHLLLGKGMCSDDTEHTCMLAQALVETAHGEPELAARRFASNLAWRLRFWLLGLPAGIGFATLRAILKLWLGFPPRVSGVFSAGNGPAMRVALIGVCFGEDEERMRTLTRAATRITHTDPKAEHGALAVALAAYFASTHDAIIPQGFANSLRNLLGHEGEELCEVVDRVAASVSAGEPTAAFAGRIGCAAGVSGYMLHSVPVALHAWMRHPDDYQAAITETIRLGGDTDTVAAIVGALVGARTGKAGIPERWIADLWEWPRTIGWMEKLGTALARSCADRSNQRAPRAGALRPLARNVFFAVLVLLHGFRRLLPPY